MESIILSSILYGWLNLLDCNYIDTTESYNNNNNAKPEYMKDMDTCITKYLILGYRISHCVTVSGHVAKVLHI